MANPPPPKKTPPGSLVKLSWKKLLPVHVHNAHDTVGWRTYIVTDRGAENVPILKPAGGFRTLAGQIERYPVSAGESELFKDPSPVT